MRLGTSEAKMSSFNALGALLARAKHPTTYNTDRLAWESFDSRRSNFQSYKRKLAEALGQQGEHGMTLLADAASHLGRAIHHSQASSVPVIGRRVSIWSYSDRGEPWHSGSVINAQADGTHEILFDDGSRVSYPLEQTQAAGLLCWLDVSDPSQPYYLDVDSATSGGTGAVLQQRQDPHDPDSLRPIAFWSRRIVSPLPSPPSSPQGGRIRSRPLGILRALWLLVRLFCNARRVSDDIARALEFLKQEATIRRARATIRRAIRHRGATLRYSPPRRVTLNLLVGPLGAVVADVRARGARGACLEFARGTFHIGRTVNPVHIPNGSATVFPIYVLATPTKAFIMRESLSHWITTLSPALASLGLHVANHVVNGSDSPLTFCSCLNVSGHDVYIAANTPCARVRTSVRVYVGERPGSAQAVYAAGGVPSDRLHRMVEFMWDDTVQEVLSQYYWNVLHGETDERTPNLWIDEYVLRPVGGPFLWDTQRALRDIILPQHHNTLIETGFMAFDVWGRYDALCAEQRVATTLGRIPETRFPAPCSVLTRFDPDDHSLRSYGISVTGDLVTIGAYYPRMLCSRAFRGTGTQLLYRRSIQHRNLAIQRRNLAATRIQIALLKSRAYRRNARITRLMRAALGARLSRKAAALGRIQTSAALRIQTSYRLKFSRGTEEQVMPIERRRSTSRAKWKAAAEFSRHSSRFEWVYPLSNKTVVKYGSEMSAHRDVSGADLGWGFLEEGDELDTGALYKHALIRGRFRYKKHSPDSEDDSDYDSDEISAAAASDRGDGRAHEMFDFKLEWHPANYPDEYEREIVAELAAIKPPPPSPPPSPSSPSHSLPSFGEILEVIMESEQLLTFRDRETISKEFSYIHHLTSPKWHFSTAADCTQLKSRADAELVVALVRQQVACIHAEVGDSFDPLQLLLGFHMPPHVSCAHLHLHALYPASAVAASPRAKRYDQSSLLRPSTLIARMRHETLVADVKAWWQPQSDPLPFVFSSEDPLPRFAVAKSAGRLRQSTSALRQSAKLRATTAQQPAAPVNLTLHTVKNSTIASAFALGDVDTTSADIDKYRDICKQLDIALDESDVVQERRMFAASTIRTAHVRTVGVVICLADAQSQTRSVLSHLNGDIESIFVTNCGIGESPYEALLRVCEPWFAGRQIELEFRNKLRLAVHDKENPGQSLRWTINPRDSTGKGVSFRASGRSCHRGELWRVDLSKADFTQRLAVPNSLYAEQLSSIYRRQLVLPITTPSGISYAPVSGNGLLVDPSLGVPLPFAAPTTFSAASSRALISSVSSEFFSRLSAPSVLGYTEWLQTPMELLFKSKADAHAAMRSDVQHTANATDNTSDEEDPPIPIVGVAACNLGELSLSPPPRIVDLSTLDWLDMPAEPKMFDIIVHGAVTGKKCESRLNRHNVKLLTPHRSCIRLNRLGTGHVALIRLKSIHFYARCIDGVLAHGDDLLPGYRALSPLEIERAFFSLSSMSAEEWAAHFADGKPDNFLVAEFDLINPSPLTAVVPLCISNLLNPRRLSSRAVLNENAEEYEDPAAADAEECAKELKSPQPAPPVAPEKGCLDFNVRVRYMSDNGARFSLPRDERLLWHTPVSTHTTVAELKLIVVQQNHLAFPPEAFRSRRKLSLVLDGTQAEELTEDNFSLSSGNAASYHLSTNCVVHAIWTEDGSLSDAETVDVPAHDPALTASDPPQPSSSSSSSQKAASPPPESNSKPGSGPHASFHSVNLSQEPPVPSPFMAQPVAPPLPPPPMEPSVTARVNASTAETASEPGSSHCADSPPLPHPVAPLPAISPPLSLPSPAAVLQASLPPAPETRSDHSAALSPLALQFNSKFPPRQLSSPVDDLDLPPFHKAGVNMHSSSGVLFSSAPFPPPPAKFASQGFLATWDHSNAQLKFASVKRTTDGKWFTFGGKREPSDPSPVATCVREVLEESGLFIPAANFNLVNTRCGVIGGFWILSDYVCILDSHFAQSASIGAPHEHTALRWFTLEEIAQLDGFDNFYERASAAAAVLRRAYFDIASSLIPTPVLAPSRRHHMRSGLRRYYNGLLLPLSPLHAEATRRILDSASVVCTADIAFPADVPLADVLASLAAMQLQPPSQSSASQSANMAKDTLPTVPEEEPCVPIPLYSPPCSEISEVLPLALVCTHTGSLPDAAVVSQSTPTLSCNFVVTSLNGLPIPVRKLYPWRRLAYVWRVIRAGWVPGAGRQLYWQLANSTSPRSHQRLIELCRSHRYAPRPNENYAGCSPHYAISKRPSFRANADGSTGGALLLRTPLPQFWLLPVRRARCLFGMRAVLGEMVTPEQLAAGRAQTQCVIDHDTKSCTSLIALEPEGGVVFPFGSPGGGAEGARRVGFQGCIVDLALNLSDATRYFGSTCCLVPRITVHHGDALDQDTCEAAIRAHPFASSILGYLPSPCCADGSSASSFVDLQPSAQQNLSADVAMRLASFARYKHVFITESTTANGNIVKPSIGPYSIAHARELDLGIPSYGGHVLVSPKGCTLVLESCLASQGIDFAARSCTGSAKAILPLGYDSCPMSAPCCTGQLVCAYHPSYFGGMNLRRMLNMLGFHPSHITSKPRLNNALPPLLGAWVAGKFGCHSLRVRHNVPIIHYDDAKCDQRLREWHDRLHFFIQKSPLALSSLRFSPSIDVAIILLPQQFPDTVLVTSDLKLPRLSVSLEGHSVVAATAALFNSKYPGLSQTPRAHQADGQHSRLRFAFDGLGLKCPSLYFTSSFAPDSALPVIREAIERVNHLAAHKHPCAFKQGCLAFASSRTENKNEGENEEEEERLYAVPLHALIEHAIEVEEFSLLHALAKVSTLSDILQSITAPTSTLLQPFVKITESSPAFSVVQRLADEAGYDELPPFPSQPSTAFEADVLLATSLNLPASVGPVEGVFTAAATPVTANESGSGPRTDSNNLLQAFTTSSSELTSTLAQPTNGQLLRFTTPGGIFNPTVLSSFEAIAIPDDCSSTLPSTPLSEELSSSLAYGCPYRKRTSRRASFIASPETCSRPGTLSFTKSTKSSLPDVYNMHTQFFQGRPRNKRAASAQNDSTHDRIQWIRDCLDALGTRSQNAPTSIAFPWLMGSTPTEGGDWRAVINILKDFALKHPSIKVAVVQSTSDSLSKALQRMQPVDKVASSLMSFAMEERNPETQSLFVALAAELNAGLLTPSAFRDSKPLS